MNLATPAPKVESAVAEPAIRDNSVTNVEPPSAVEEATAEPASAVEPAETVDNPHKYAPSNALSYLQQKSAIGVEALRKQGVDFECRVAVCKGGAPKKGFLKLVLPMFFDQRDFVTFSEVARYAVIQNNCCFIFLEATDLTPLYAFALSDMTTEIEDRDNPDKFSVTINPVNNTSKSGEGLVTVLLRYKRNGRIAYQFTFDTVSEGKEVIKSFMDVVDRNSSGGAAKAVVEASVTASTIETCKKDEK